MARRAFVLALCALAGFPRLARAEPPFRDSPVPPPADGYARALLAFTEVEPFRLVVWRPKTPSGILLIDAEEEPKKTPGTAQPDILAVARARGMTILFLGAFPDAPSGPWEFSREKILEMVIARSRSSLAAKKVIGIGSAGGANFLSRFATKIRGKPIDALLLLDNSPLPPLGEDTPFLIETWGSEAYWRHAPRLAGSLASAPENRRLFFVAGGGRPLVSDANCALPANRRSMEPARRALLVALDDYLRGGPPPPRSRMAELATAKGLTWPKIPKLPMPGADDRRVPKIDSDGNEIGGLRLPDQALPIATFTGWNAPIDKAKGDCALGARLPFPASRAAREASGDPRQSLPERYGSRAYYVGALRSVADKLVKERLLLPSDADAYVTAGKAAPF